MTLKMARVNLCLIIVLLVAYCVLAAVDLYLAIDMFLTGRPVWSAIYTGIAFYFSGAFARETENLAIYRKIITDLKVQQ